MNILAGTSVVEGIAVGIISVYKCRVKGVTKYVVNDTEQEIKRFKDAIDIAIAQYDELYNKALLEVGKENAAIFDIYKVILKDEMFINQVIHMIEREHVNVEYSLTVTFEEVYDKFTNLNDTLIRERIVDLKDIYQRLIMILKEYVCDNTLANPVIILADELTPSDLMQVETSKILGFATKKGSINSHVAILAKIMNIPSIMHIDYTSLEGMDGKTGIIDGYDGKLYIDADIVTTKKLLYKKEEEDRKDSEIMKSIENKAFIIGDRSIQVHGNISSVHGVEDVLKYSGDGIGLLRSEFLFINHEKYPMEEEQFIEYREIVESMRNKLVVIRTFDYGSDKEVPFFIEYKKKCSDYSLRGIRISLKYKELLYQQIKAIYRASHFGQVAILYPMIISVEEVRQIIEMETLVKEELLRDGYSYKDIKRGIMIETPAAVMISDLLAKEVDFFSIGTNDLTQYTLAIDREEELDNRDKNHLAISRMIKLVIENGHKEGILVGICGEVASDTNKTEELLSYGIDYLSVVPTKIIKVKETIRSIISKISS